MEVALVALSGRGSGPELVAPQKRMAPRISRAGVLVTEPELFETTTRYSPTLTGCALVTVNARLLAFETGLSLNCHWYCNGSELDARTLNAAFIPAATFTLWGGRVMVGACANNSDGQTTQSQQITSAVAKRAGRGGTLRIFFMSEINFCSFSRILIPRQFRNDIQGATVGIKREKYQSFFANYFALIARGHLINTGARFVIPACSAEK